jgi:hypothetical protein
MPPIRKYSNGHKILYSQANNISTQKEPENLKCTVTQTLQANSYHKQQLNTIQNKTANQETQENINNTVNS